MTKATKRQTSPAAGHPVNSDLGGEECFSEYGVQAKVDEEMRAILEVEASVMDDPDFEPTIRRRLIAGLDMAVAMGPRALQWRPVHRDASVFNVWLPASAMEALQLAMDEFGYGLDVLIATLIYDPACKPMEVVAAEATYRAKHPAEYQAPRREPGKGNIYPVQLEMPGYQLVFIRMLTGQVVDRAQIIEEALVALARQALLTCEVAGFRLTAEAHDMASRMVSMAPNLIAIRNQQTPRYGGR